MYGNLGMCLVESMRAVRLDKEHYLQRVNFSEESKARFQDILSRGKGCLVLTAHLGNWEMLSSVYYHLDVMCSIITKEMKNPAVNEVLNGIRRLSGGQVFPRNNAYRPSLKALSKNEIVAFVLDQNMIDTEGVFVDFMGRPACTSPGLAHISASTGVPVLPVFVVRERPGWYRLEVGDTLEPPPERTEEALRDSTQLYTSKIEEMVRRFPDQWILIHRRWRTKPPTPETENEKTVGGEN
jgi:KDO2-lipid IV(A) lauroyltransferase